MRDLDQRMEQIALRSKIRKQKRKKLAWLCVPAVLCIGLGIILWPKPPAQFVTEGIMEQPALEPMYGYSDGAALGAVSGPMLELRDSQIATAYLQEDTVRQVWTLLDSLYTDVPESQVAVEDHSAATQPETADDGGAQTYTLTLTEGDKEQVYLWQDRKITCRETGQTRYLSPEQEILLKQLLEMA